MSIPFFKKNGIPFDGLREHAEIVKECGWSFQQAIECYVSNRPDRFEEYRKDVDRLESEADAVKRSVRASISKKSRLQVSRFTLFMYIKEQDKVLDMANDSLNLISFKPAPGIPENLQNDFFDLVNAVILPIEELSVMVFEARKYFESYSEHQRQIVKEIIRNLRKSEHDADIMEDGLKYKIFSEVTDAISVFHLINLTGMIGAIADHAENAGDMMRAMITK
jgi:uncharacterized protein